MLLLPCAVLSALFPGVYLSLISVLNLSVVCMIRHVMSLVGLDLKIFVLVSWMPCYQYCMQGNDVFVRMATGCGKSLCMFLPPLVHGEKAAGVIISPLVGLMDEQVLYFFMFNLKGCHIVVAQVHKLRSYKLSAVRVSEGNSQKYEDVKRGRYRYGRKVLMSI